MKAYIVYERDSDGRGNYVIGYAIGRPKNIRAYYSGRDEITLQPIDIIDASLPVIKNRSKLESAKEILLRRAHRLKGSKRPAHQRALDEVIDQLYDLVR